VKHLLILLISILYSKSRKKYIERSNDLDIKDDDKMDISGSEARKIFLSGKCPPKWFMRPKISKTIMDSINNKMYVFVK
jgi:ATP sulfurylase